MCTERRKGGFPLEKGIKGNRYKAIDRGRSSRSLMAWKNSKSQLTFRHCMSAIVAAATRIPCTLRIGNAHCPVSLSLSLLLYLTFLRCFILSLSFFLFLSVSFRSPLHFWHAPFSRRNWLNARTSDGINCKDSKEVLLALIA